MAKPCEPARLVLLVRRTLEQRRLIDELEQLRHQLREDYRFHNIVSKSPKMRRIFDLIKHVGPLGSTVLIWGETGTGKELIAQAIHASDTRRDGPFVALNCAALERLAPRERAVRPRARGLHRRRPAEEGAVRGWPTAGRSSSTRSARSRRRCRPSSSGSSSRGRSSGSAGPRRSRSTSGSSRPRTSGSRTRSRRGRFRSDLFYRLAVVRIDVPPLRERAEDIPLLALHFLEKLTAKSTPPVTEIDSEAMQALLEHTWPGHVRELENAIKAAVAMADGTVIHRDALPATVAPRKGPSRRLDRINLIDIERPLPDLTGDLVSQVERDYFTRLLAHYKGNVARCAKHSGLSRRSVTQKLQKYELDRTRFKDPSSQDARPNSSQ